MTESKHLWRKNVFSEYVKSKTDGFKKISSKSVSDKFNRKYHHRLVIFS